MPLDEFLASKLSLIDGVTYADLQMGAHLDRYARWLEDPQPWVMPDVQVQSQVVEGRHGDIPLRIYSPPGPGGSVLIWLHGGGFFSGDLEMNESHVVASELAARSGTTVVSVGYRLATGSVRYPVPVDDAEDVWNWLDPSMRRSIGGASAGAAIALAVAKRATRAGDPVQRLLLAYPFVHFPIPPADDDLARQLLGLPPLLRFPTQFVEFMVRTFVGRLSDLPKEALPGSADLRGLPPTTILVSELDDLRGSGELLGRQLAEVGVPVAVHLARGMIHGHLNRTPSLPEVAASLETFASVMRDA